MLLLAPLMFWGVFFVFVCIYTAPVTLVLFLARRRITRNLGRFTLAVAFASTAIYLLVDSEFATSFYGTPQHEKLFIFACCLGAHGAIGWLVGGNLVPGRSKQTTQ